MEGYLLVLGLRLGAGRFAGGHPPRPRFALVPFPDPSLFGFPFLLICFTSSDTSC